VTFRLSLASLACSLTWASAQTDPSTLCTPDAPIKSIEVERINVFDLQAEGENRKIFRAVNILHRPMLTRDFTVRALLTLRVGDPCTLERLSEAERALRAVRIFQDAWVEPIVRDPDGVIVRVRVRDAWSTRARVSFSSAGGADQSSFKVLEKNLFGTGLLLSWESRKDQDRTEKLVELRAPQLFGSRWQAVVLDGKNSDGRARELSIGLPFWKLDARQAFAADLQQRSAEQKVYVGPDVVDRYDLDARGISGSFGWSPRGFVAGEVTRYALGLTWERMRWAPTAENGPVARPDLTPIDRDRLLFGGQWSWLRPEFRKLRYYNSARRVEDFDLGSTRQVALGLALPGYSEQRGGRLKADWTRGFAPSERALLLTSASFELDKIESEIVNQVLRAKVRWWNKPSELHVLYFEADAAFGQRMEGTTRFLLGGDNGLRGYRSRAFSGSESVLVTLEHRYFAPWELLHLFRVGLVSFVEAGAIWEEGEPLSWARVHPDIGIGLRFEILRSSSDTTLQLNAAYPLDPNGDPEEGQKIQFSVITGKGF
jgi:hypothetical protein